MFGKYWSRVPTKTPARSAMCVVCGRLVVMLIGDICMHSGFVFAVAIGGDELVLRRALMEGLGELRVAGGVAA